MKKQSIIYLLKSRLLKQDNTFFIILSFLISLNLIPINTFALNQYSDKYYDLQKPIIVIDPGHGGNENGACSNDNHLYEKEITLNFAKKLQQALKNKYSVTLTRQDDYNIDLYDRIGMANNQKADLFISLHTGNSLQTKTSGNIAIVIFQESYNHSIDLNLSEETNIKTNQILWNELQKRHIDKSREFADILYNQLNNTNYDINTIKLSAPLALLAPADMPAAIIELGYLSNPSHAKLLTNEGFINDIIIRISKSINIFIEIKK